ncbi:hypothetical protein [Leifsonia sp. fls2-241-R2A-40a]|uniref:hypothetical protein n=1 Tax=Leifsonia sp. fls2-241-R2A-40a TaxID=3040290 RepID=UPI002550667F|nr:hypothetical protein [Leifsonia sp. fls2-241-R2A-40a]
MKKKLIPIAAAVLAAVAALSLTSCSTQQADPAFVKTLTATYGKNTTVEVAKPGQRLTGNLIPVFCWDLTGAKGRQHWAHCELGAADQTVSPLRSISGSGWENVTGYPAADGDRSTARYLPATNAKALPAYAPGPEFCAAHSTVFSALDFGDTEVPLTTASGALALDAVAYGPGFACNSASIGTTAAQDAAFQQLSTRKLSLAKLNSLPAALNAHPGAPTPWTNPVTGKTEKIGTALISVTTRGNGKTVVTVPQLAVRGPLSAPYGKSAILSADAAAKFSGGKLTFSVNLVGNPAAAKGAIVPIVCTNPDSAGTWQVCQEGAPVQIGRSQSYQDASPQTLSVTREWAAMPGVVTLPGGLTRLCLPDQDGNAVTYGLTAAKTGGISVWSCGDPANNTDLTKAVSSGLTSGKVTVGQLRTALATFCDATPDTTATFATGCAYRSTTGKTTMPVDLKVNAVDPYTSDTSW